MNLDKQRGVFFISHSVLAKRKELLAELFSKLQFIPLSVILDLGARKIEYRGISPKFREVKKGEVLPTYTITINETKALDEPEIIVTENKKLWG